ncbi:MAG: NAD(P)-binding domain-containing protein [Deltaproteobacteria bacterium]|nr:NAD(P)-binding domain-containing protein [Deltaproteobacteria bacterium]
MTTIREILPTSFEFSSKIGTRQLPKLSKDYESNVRGLYVVGDLADAPVIKIALGQGYDVANRLVDKDFRGKAPPKEDGIDVDVCVVGAGPAGIGAALALIERGVTYQLIERERPFNTIQNFPKHKHVFSEPKDFGHGARFPFMDAIKEDLVSVWERAIEERHLVIHQPEDVTSVVKKGDLFEVEISKGEGKEATKRTIKARKVILAIGRRGKVRKLGVPGEDLDKVVYGLHDPEAYRGKNVMVVGGGDSAVEAAVSLAEGGAKVTIVYRGADFIRAKALNRERIEAAIAAGKIVAKLETNPRRVDEASVLLKGKDGESEVPNEVVFALIGTELPVGFLDKVGVQMEGAFTKERLTFVTSFALITYAFYCIKAHRMLWPFGEGQALHFLHEAVKANLGFRFVDGSFWGTVIYSLMISFFGVQAIRKYKSPIQTRRYTSLIVFQLVFLFGIPELVAPLVIEQPWKVYALTVPWPLSTWSLIHIDYQNGGLQAGWMIAGGLVAFVGMPLFVRYQGERFCSWACGCGGLAETLGDRWRHLAPRGAGAKKLEILGRVIFVAAAITTATIIFVDGLKLLTGPAWVDRKAFVQDWYGLVVDFWFASVVGVAFYPYLGNRVWCRFLCPLRAYMEVLSKWIGKLRIVESDKCIGCGECTRFCQMGIPVQKFAQMREPLANHNSACIQCGICVEVCPMEVLSLERGAGSARSDAARRRLPVVN